MAQLGTVLVVDDEAAIRLLLCQALRRCGFEALEAGTGSDALELAGRYSRPIDALVSDVVMPGMNGPELARRLSAIRPSLKVILISGYTDQPSAVQPDWVFLQKPFSPSTLCNKLEELCGVHEDERTVH
jgi:DNA-binding NtrC family response regulator